MGQVLTVLRARRVEEKSRTGTFRDPDNEESSDERAQKVRGEGGRGVPVRRSSRPIPSLRLSPLTHPYSGNRNSTTSMQSMMWCGKVYKYIIRFIIAFHKVHKHYKTLQCFLEPYKTMYIVV